MEESLLSAESKSFKMSSRAVVFSGVTSMIGLGILVYPLLYKKNGVVLSQIIVTLVGMISYKTAQITVAHVRKDEDDVTQVVRRLLGPTWHKVYSISGAANLVLCSVGFYLLIVNTIYSQINFVLLRTRGVDLVSKDVYTFSTYSFQWNNLLCALGFLAMVQLRSLKTIMVMGEYSFLGIIIFVTYCFSKSFVNIHWLVETKSTDPSFQIEEIKLFGDSFSMLAGTCAVAYNCHNMIVPILAQSKNKEKNQRDVMVMFLLGFLIYSLVGILGYAAILNQPCNVEQANSFMDYMPEDEVMGFIVNIIVLLKMISITPLFIHLSKNQLFCVFFPKDTPAWCLQLYNLCYVLLVATLGNFNVEPTLIMGINGSFNSFVLIYLVPIGIHLQCLYVASCGEKYV